MPDSEPAHIPDPADEPGFDLGAVPASAQISGEHASASIPPGSQARGEAYRVLARAYRPQTFAELIGQDAMVQTLGNAIARDRLAHAFLMTGVRGVGKTSTARLIAKALNCIGPDGDSGPTIDPCGQCSHCSAIAEGRHIDVIEMDAASHTGIDDIREITDAVRYASVSARYKIYIIDEVHMLSKQAFNGLLKTLEEPPPHVKFLFATTEVQKVPVTILSRCQRFDLRRITPEMLTVHFSEILAKEGVAAEDAAVRMIATAAEGSVRDGLSLLDQAIAHSGQGDSGSGATTITATSVADMLGLSDRSVIRTLFDAILNSESGAVIDGIRAQYALGAEPLALIRGIMDLTHAVTLAKLSRTADPLLSEEDKLAVQSWSLQLGNATLHRMWQLLLKGHQEVIEAPRALEACEMALLRIMHARQMPDPGELAELLASGIAAGAASGGSAPSAAAAPDKHSPLMESTDVAAPAAEPEPVAQDTPQSSEMRTLADLEAVLISAGFHQIARLLHDHVRLIRLNDSNLVFAATAMLSAGYGNELAQALKVATGQRWQVAAQAPIADLPKDDISPETGTGSAMLSLLEQAELARKDKETAIRAHPLVDAALKAFPGAHILLDHQDVSGTTLH